MSESEGAPQPTQFKDLPPQDAYQALDTENKERLSQTAMKLFIEASIKAPASTTAQGAVIAKSCKELGLTHPDLLSECLVNDSDRLDRLKSQAAKMHEQMSIGPKSIPIDKLKDIIQQDFENAAAFINHTPEELDYIMGDMRKKHLIGGYTPKGESQLALEDTYLEDALNLLNVRKQREKEKQIQELKKKQSRFSLKRIITQEKPQST